MENSEEDMQFISGLKGLKKKSQSSFVENLNYPTVRLFGTVWQVFNFFEGVLRDFRKLQRSQLNEK